MEKSGEKSAKLSYGYIEAALQGAARIGHRDVMVEALKNSTNVVYDGLARQSVDKAQDGRLVLSESSFADDGTYYSKYVVIDSPAASAIAWEGVVVKNPDHQGTLWQLSPSEYADAAKQVTELINNYPT